jgi:alpha-L-arabinofuranosidase
VSDLEGQRLWLVQGTLEPEPPNRWARNFNVEVLASDIETAIAHVKNTRKVKEVIQVVNRTKSGTVEVAK